MKKDIQIKSYRPLTPSLRYMTREDYSEITKKTPKKSLTRIVKKTAGRDNTGHISNWHVGGGSKRKYRLISSLSDMEGKTATVKSIEYDPNRTARIALVEFEDGKNVYIIAPTGLKVNDKIISQDKTPIKTGNRLKLKNISIGTEIYDIEIQPGSRGKMVRSAGSVAYLAAKAEGEGKRNEYVQVKMPSGEIRLLHKECYASIGRVSNISHSSITIGKAGRKRWMGIRPTVRGKSMNANDHPHGGGEGHNPIGMKHPKTPWGKPALGYKTRKNKRTDKFIIKRKKK